MASQATPRHEAIVERLQQLLDAIRIMQKMVGNEEQTWVAESAEAVANFEPTAANTAYVNAVKYLYDVTTRCTSIEASSLRSIEFSASSSLPDS